MIDLPVMTEANKTGRRGVTILQARLEELGWIVRRQDGDSDFGIDGEIEIVDSNRVSGRLVKFQCKATEGIKWKHGEATVSVKARTYNLWAATPLLTILIYVNTKTGGIFWTPALAHYPKAKAESLSIKFEKTSNLKKTTLSLESYVKSWHAAAGADGVLKEIPIFYPLFAELNKDVDHYDEWMDIHEDTEADFRLFYIHALRLRLQVGLTNDHIPTFEEWVARSKGFFPDLDGLSWATFSEAMKLIAPYYRQAVDRIVERTNQTAFDLDTAELKSFVSRNFGPGYRMGFIDPRSTNAAFHKKMEHALEKAGVRKKYEFHDTKPKKS